MSQDRDLLACKESSGKVRFDCGEATDDVMLCSRRKRISSSTVEECDRPLTSYKLE